MADMRQLIEQAFDELASDDAETVKNFVRDAFALEKEKSVFAEFTCKDCGKRQRHEIKVKIPDFKERAKAIDQLLTQAKGKPRETKQLDVRVGQFPASELTLAEIEAEERTILSQHPELAG